MKYNTKVQSYKGIKIRLIEYTKKHFARLKAKRFLLISDKDMPYPSQNFWIPNVYLEDDGTLKSDINIDFVFRKCLRANKLKYAGIKPPQWLQTDLVYRKGEWYHLKDDELIPVDYEKEVKEYYKKRGKNGA